jgi:glyoxylase-like metal-dependent hydrolase (beta-lactamase superfamily II)
MPAYICVTCGVQHAPADAPPARCAICEDERQYLGYEGQRWTTLAELQKTHHNLIRDVEPGLSGVGTQPGFAIGQRALLVQTPEGNVLWDCISLIDRPTVAALRDLGGVRAIAISHPHFYSSLAEWAEAFDVPVYLHAADRAHLMRPDARVVFWEGEAQPLWGGLTILRLGGHFAGSSALHWPAGAEGRGALLTGDTIQVVQDRRFVSFMRSYPNLIPLPATTVRRIADTAGQYEFERIYGGWWDRVVAQDARAAVARSAERYIAALEAEER